MAVQLLRSPAPAVTAKAVQLELAVAAAADAVDAAAVEAAVAAAAAALVVHQAAAADQRQCDLYQGLMLHDC